GRSLTLTDIVGADVVSLSGGTATFGSAAAATGKTVTGINFGLSGADAGNYQLDSTTLTTTADITPKTLFGHFTASNKVYDGTVALFRSGRSLTLTDIVGADVVSLSGGTATFG